MTISTRSNDWKRSRSIVLALLVGFIAIVASACADVPFDRVSVFDKQFRTPGRIVGLPDTFTAVGDAAQLSLDVNDRFRDIPRRWSTRQLDFAICSSDCGILRVDASTGRMVATPNSYRTRWEVRVQMAEQIYFDTVATRQIPVGFRSYCRSSCDAIAHDTPIDYLITDAELLDANGVSLALQTDTALRAGATLTIRDTTIVHFVDGRLYSRFTNGSTWIVRRQFGRADSVQSNVEQALGGSRLQCPETAAVSDTVRPRVVLTDVNGRPMKAPVRLVWELRAPADNEQGHAFRPIAPDGSFVPANRGGWRVSVIVVHSSAALVASCTVQIL